MAQPCTYEWFKYCFPSLLHGRSICVCYGIQATWALPITTLVIPPSTSCQMPQTTRASGFSREVRTEPAIPLPWHLKCLSLICPFRTQSVVLVDFQRTVCCFGELILLFNKYLLGVCNISGAGDIILANHVCPLGVYSDSLQGTPLPSHHSASLFS